MLCDSPPAAVYPVRWANPPFGGRYHDTACVVFHQMIETGGSTLARVVLERSRRRNKTFFNAEAALADRDALRQAGDSVDFLYGHNAFGLHHDAPAPARYFTMLREPVVAYISRFHNWKFMDPASLGASTLEEFVEEGQSPNHQARDLARCVEDFQPIDYDLDDDSIHRDAQRVLDEKIVFCGITDLFDETVFLLCAIFGWDDASMWHRRLATPGRPAVDDLPRELVAKIERLVAIDLELYHQQREKLLDLFAATGFDTTFAHYQADAAQTQAASFEVANVQKYALLADKLRRESASKDAQIADLEEKLRLAQWKVAQQDAALRKAANLRMRMREGV